MKSLIEPARETPVADEVDLCVVGGSCTGVFAAVAAARQGLRVALVEHHGFFGGVATARMVNVWHSLFTEDGARQIVAGLSVELMERLKARDAVMDRGHHPHYQFAFNSAELILELDRLVTPHPAIRPFLHSRCVAAALRAPGEIDAIIVEDIGGRRAIRARAFIDASGDCALLRQAGLPVVKSAMLQPPTTAFLLQGHERLLAANPGLKLHESVFDKKFPEALPPGFCWTAAIPGARDVSCVFGTRVHGADCSDPDQLTRAEIEGRRQVRAISELIRHRLAGGRDTAVLALPACTGIRETYRGQCQHTLTEDEVLRGRRFGDAVANSSYRVDLHLADRGGNVFRYLDGREEIVVPGQPREHRRWRAEQAENPTFYQVPYRALLPLGARNVIAAGRTIGTDPGAYGATRVMITCNQTGEAAGLAVALALRGDTTVAEVAPEKLRRLLAETGSIVA